MGGWLDDWFVTAPPVPEQEEPDESWLGTVKAMIPDLDTKEYCAIGAVSLGAIFFFFQNLFGKEPAPVVKKNFLESVAGTISGNESPEDGDSVSMMTILVVGGVALLLLVLTLVYFCSGQRAAPEHPLGQPDIEEGFLEEQDRSPNPSGLSRGRPDRYSWMSRTPSRMSRSKSRRSRSKSRGSGRSSHRPAGFSGFWPGQGQSRARSKGFIVPS